MKHAILALGVAVLVAGAVAPAAAQAPADSALQAELDAMLRELHGDWGASDPFLEGRPPDLFIVTTSDVRGEVAPCG